MHLIGMVHLRALPGTPRSAMPVAEIAAIAAREARMLVECGFDTILVENMHDAPYLKRAVGPEIVAAVAVCVRAVRDAVAVPVGLQVLAGANREAMAVAHACGLDFIRAEGFVFGHVADEGIMESDAGELLRYRRAIGASGVRVFADIKKKHSAHAITADVSLAETAEAAAFFGADGVIVTGSATGKAASIDDVRAVRAATALPLWIGSGITPANAADYAGMADGFVVGSSIKAGGRWDGEIDPAAARRVVQACR